MFNQASNVNGTGTQTYARVDFMSSLSTASYGTQVTLTLSLYSTASIILSIKSSCSLKEKPKFSYRKQYLMSVISLEESPRRKLKSSYRLLNQVRGSYKILL